MSTSRGKGRRLGFLLFLLGLSILGLGQSPQAPLGGLTELYPWPEDPQNLIGNSSFENRDRADVPGEWTLGEPNSWSLDSSTRHSGRTSLRLSDSHLARFTPMATQRLSLQPGWYSLRGFVRAERAGTNVEGSGGRLSVWKGSNGISTEALAGNTDWVELERGNIVISPRDSPSLRIEAYRKPDGRVYFDDIEFRRLVPPRVEGFLLYPNYRGALFDDASQTILVSVTLRPEADDPSLVARVSLEQEGGPLIAAVEEEIPPHEPRTISLDASRAPAGRFRLRLQALDARNRSAIFEHPSYTIVKMPATEKAALRAYIDDDNVLVIDGRRRFPLGIYDTSGRSASPGYYTERISKIAEAPFTLYLNYWLGIASKAELEALTTTLRQFGMSYIHTSNAWYESNPEWSSEMQCGATTAGNLGQTTFTVCKAQELSELPGLLGWYTADERPAGAAGRVFEQYRLLRENDRDGVTFIAQNRPNELVRWRDATDVVGVDPYPIFNVPEGTSSPLEMVTNWVRIANDSVEGSRPVWAVIQFFKHGAGGHFPTYDELRTMSYMAIVAGAKGLFYWSFGARGLEWVESPTQKETYWKRLVGVTQEIAGLEAVLVAPDGAPVLQSVSEPERIRWLGKELNGTRYVFAVNNTSAHVEATLTLASSASRADVLEENRSVSVSGRSLRDSFRPYEAHVYRLR
ncbi:MAG: hypothetical protein ACRD21_02570 [Vicinamibacteria bacterium]